MSENSRVRQARLALIVSGEELPFDEISSLLQLAPTRLVRRGDLLNRLPEIRSREDEWIHLLELETPKGRDEKLSRFLGYLIGRKEELEKIRAFGDVRLRMRIQSDYAQMSYSLESETIHEMDEIGLPLDITSISWGEIGI